MKSNPARSTAREQSRKVRQPPRDLRWPRDEESLWSPGDRFVLQEVMAERDRLKEQLDNVRELSSRLIDTCDAKDEQIRSLEAQICAKDAMIADLEQENEQLIGVVSERETRISTLQRFLQMMAEADERL
jgi:hypothetical protein